MPEETPDNPTVNPEEGEDERMEPILPPPPDSASAAPPDFVWTTDTGLPVDYGPWTPEGPPQAAERHTHLIRGLSRVARDLVEVAILALLLFVGIRSVVQNFRVDGESMEGTLQNGQQILVNKALYYKVNLSFLNFLPFFDAGKNPEHYIFRAPRRGDVIVFQFPAQPDRDFIKRIIGEPGETVEVRDGLVFINGKVLDEKYPLERPHYNYGPEVVPDGQYFVLGDNRNNSFDSHSWGMLEEKYIIGRAWVTYWPFSSFGLISDPAIEPLGSQESTP